MHNYDHEGYATLGCSHEQLVARGSEALATAIEGRELLWQKAEDERRHHANVLGRLRAGLAAAKRAALARDFPAGTRVRSRNTGLLGTVAGSTGLGVAVDWDSDHGNVTMTGYKPSDLVVMDFESAPAPDPATRQRAAYCRCNLQALVDDDLNAPGSSFANSIARATRLSPEQVAANDLQVAVNRVEAVYGKSVHDLRALADETVKAMAANTAAPWPQWVEPELRDDDDADEGEHCAHLNGPVTTLYNPKADDDDDHLAGTLSAAVQDLQQSIGRVHELGLFHYHRAHVDNHPAKAELPLQALDVVETPGGSVGIVTSISEDADPLVIVATESGDRIATRPYGASALKLVGRAAK